jgi:hypothetical protein
MYTKHTTVQTLVGTYFRYYIVREKLVDTIRSIRIISKMYCVPWSTAVMARKGGLFEVLGLPYVGLYQNFRLTKREFFP